MYIHQKNANCERCARVRVFFTAGCARNDGGALHSMAANTKSWFDTDPKSKSVKHSMAVSWSNPTASAKRKLAHGGGRFGRSCTIEPGFPSSFDGR